MLLRDLAELSTHLTQTRKRIEKTQLIAGCFAQAEPAERPLVALYLSGVLRQAKLGVGPAQVWALRDVPPAETAALTLPEVDGALAAIAELRGSGSVQRRSDSLRAL